MLLRAGGREDQDGHCIFCCCQWGDVLLAPLEPGKGLLALQAALGHLLLGLWPPGQSQGQGQALQALGKLSQV